MSEPRKHHFLPQFYLRGFSVDRRGLYQIEKKTAKYYGCQIKDIAAIKDFHKLDYEDAKDPNALEKALAQIEGEYAEHLATFLAEGLANEHARLYTVQLLALLRIRVPAFKRHIEASYQSSIRKVAELMEREGKFPVPPAGLEETLKIKNLKIEIMNWKCLEIMFNLAADEKHLDPLYRMRTTLMHAPFGTSFITSDQPVSLYHPTAAKSPYGVGPDTPGIEISLPLCSRTLLFLDHVRGPHTTRTATTDEVNELNRRTVAMAQEYVFAGEFPELYVDIVRREKGTRSGFIFDDLDHGEGLLQVHRFIPVGPRMAS